MTKLELVNKLHGENVYTNLTEIKSMIENDNTQEHAAANKQMLIVLRRMINMNDWAVMDAFEMIEMASSLRGMARAFTAMTDGGTDLIDDDIYDLIDDEWKIITTICKAAIRGEEAML